MRRPAHILAIAALTVAGSTLLAACGDDTGGISVSGGSTTTAAEGADDGSSGDGGDSSDIDPADKEAFIAYFSDSDDIISAQQGDCAAEAAIPDLSGAAMTTILAGGEFDLKAFGTSDAGVLIAALDECVPLNSAVEAFAGGVTSSEGLPITDEEASCAAEQFAREYRGSGEFIDAVTTMSEDEAGTRLLGALGTCLTDEGAAEFMSTVLSQQGMDEATARCIGEGIVAAIGKEQMMAAIVESGTGGSSTALEDATTQAMISCGVTG